MASPKVTSVQNLRIGSCLEKVSLQLLLIKNLEVRMTGLGPWIHVTSVITGDLTDLWKVAT